MDLFLKNTLRDLLEDGEVPGVDALLRRLNGMLSEAGHLNSSEKQEILEGHKALCRLFYKK